MGWWYSEDGFISFISVKIKLCVSSDTSGQDVVDLHSLICWVLHHIYATPSRGFDLCVVHRWPPQRKVVKRKKGDPPSTRWSLGNIQSTFTSASMECEWFFFSIKYTRANNPCWVHKMLLITFWISTDQLYHTSLATSSHKVVCVYSWGKGVLNTMQLKSQSR